MKNDSIRSTLRMMDKGCEYTLRTIYLTIGKKAKRDKVRYLGRNNVFKENRMLMYKDKREKKQDLSQR